MIKIYDDENSKNLYNSYFIEVDNNGDNVHFFDVNCEICTIEDLIMLLKEDCFDTGEINFSDNYQFNGFFICGSDLIDHMKKHGV